MVRAGGVAHPRDDLRGQRRIREFLSVLALGELEEARAVDEQVLVGQGDAEVVRAHRPGDRPDPPSVPRVHTAPEAASQRAGGSYSATGSSKAGPAPRSWSRIGVPPSSAEQLRRRLEAGERSHPAVAVDEDEGSARGVGSVGRLRVEQAPVEEDGGSGRAVQPGVAGDALGIWIAQRSLRQGAARPPAMRARDRKRRTALGTDVGEEEQAVDEQQGGADVDRREVLLGHVSVPAEAWPGSRRRHEVLVREQANARPRRGRRPWGRSRDAAPRPAPPAASARGWVAARSDPPASRRSEAWCS